MTIGPVIFCEIIFFLKYIYFITQRSVPRSLPSPGAIPLPATGKGQHPANVPTVQVGLFLDVRHVPKKLIQELHLKGGLAKPYFFFMI